MKIAASVLTALSLARYGLCDDLFTYDEEKATRNVYGPKDWEDVDCDDTKNCPGWPDRWDISHFTVDQNDCRWCPKGASRKCSEHHQSPIALTREWADEGSEKYDVCRDQHWMKYDDSSCSWEDLEKDSFTIERHTLKLSQPVEYSDKIKAGYRLDCEGSRGRRFGRIDFSWGFNAWFYLNFMDIKIPSEHTQNGKRYTAEVQHAHFFEVPADQARNLNEMGTVSVFLQAEENYPPYPHLDRMLCAWRLAEDKIRKSCGLESISDPYPSCFQPSTEDEEAQRERRTTEQQPVHNRTSFSNYMKEHHPRGERIQMDEENFHPEPDMTDNEYHEFVQKESRRNLYEQRHYPFHAYQILIDCRTEYYFRYHGTTTVPPCYATVPDVYGELDGHENTNHWRVMKDPIRIAMRQKHEMERLLRERIDPTKCVKDTAAKVDETTGEVYAARPLQEQDKSHMSRFCWCPFWKSKWAEDRAWCNSYRKNDVKKVLYEKPYNYDSYV